MKHAPPLGSHPSEESSELSHTAVMWESRLRHEVAERGQDMSPELLNERNKQRASCCSISF